MFFFLKKGNQVNVNVKESLDGEAELGNHSLRIACSAFKVNRAAFLSLPCAANGLNKPWGYLSTRPGAALPPTAGFLPESAQRPASAVILRAPPPPSIDMI